MRDLRGWRGFPSEDFDQKYVVSGILGRRYGLSMNR